jgi:hypothetical protein
LFSPDTAAPQCGQCAQPRSMPRPHCKHVGRKDAAQFGQNVYADFTDAPHFEQ